MRSEILTLIVALSHPDCRAILAAPRSFLQAAPESDDDPTLLNQIETVFVETPSYSDRVIGLGLWQPCDVPWLTCAPTAWFGQDHADTKKNTARPIALDLDAAQTKSLRQHVAEAIERGESVVMFHRPEEAPIQVPATREMLDALTKRATANSTKPDAAENEEKSQLEVLLILTNEAQVDHEQDFARRPALPSVEPDCLITQLKQHQAHGLRWLQDSWLAGAPGVLLADDMGLGKTLQGLAFLAWLREAMQRGAIPRAPVLIVAPTGLLANWSAEHARHLSGAGLGDCLAALEPGFGVSADRILPRSITP